MKAVFILTALITIALTARSSQGLESAIIWWINFLPACAMLYRYAVGYSLSGFIKIWPFSIGTYLFFHSWHFEGFKDLPIYHGVEFWPISVLSLIIVTYLTIIELKS